MKVKLNGETENREDWGKGKGKKRKRLQEDSKCRLMLIVVIREKTLNVSSKGRKFEKNRL